MTAKHQHPEYRKNARIIRQQVALARRQDRDVICGRCGRPIDPEQRYDVGHRDPQGGHALDNLRPEHRRENRSAGGRQGAAQTARNRSHAAGMLQW